MVSDCFEKFKMGKIWEKDVPERGENREEVFGIQS